MAFAGMNMAANAGSGAKGLFKLGNEQKGADTWKCTCGIENAGNFCSNCGKSKD